MDNDGRKIVCNWLVNVTAVPNFVPRVFTCLHALLFLILAPVAVHVPQSVNLKKVTIKKKIFTMKYLAIKRNILQ